MDSTNHTSTYTIWEGSRNRIQARDYEISPELKYTWESAERTGKQGPVDGVDVIATYTSEDTEKIILVANFRPPIGKFCIGFPAGRIEPDEDPRACGLRELKEETGYTATLDEITYVSKAGNGDPWKSNESSLFIKAHIDKTRPENQNPVQNLDKCENIEVIEIPHKTMLAEMLAIAEAKDYGIETRVYMYAQGVNSNNLA